MILLQASICLSAGVPSLVQSGPSCALDWAEAGGGAAISDHAAATINAPIRKKRRMKSGLGNGSTRHCEERSDEAIRFLSLRGEMDSFAELVIGRRIALDSVGSQ